MDLWRKRRVRRRFQVMSLCGRKADWDRHVVPDDFDEEASKTAMNARQAAQYAFEQYLHFIKDKDKNEFYMFNDEDGMYSTTETHDRTAYHILNEYGFVEHKQYTEVLSFMRGQSQLRNQSSWTHERRRYENSSSPTEFTMRLPLKMDLTLALFAALRFIRW